MKKGILCFTALCFVLSAGVAFAQKNADTILYNGKVLTVDAQFSVAEAVAVRDDRIVAVGSSGDVLKLAGPNTLRVDLEGKTVTPGLIHTHVHMESPGRYGRGLPAVESKRYPLNFRIVKTKEDVIKQVRDTIAAFDFESGEWIQFSTNPDNGRMVVIEMNPRVSRSSALASNTDPSLAGPSASSAATSAPSTSSPSARCPKSESAVSIWDCGSTVSRHIPGINRHRDPGDVRGRVAAQPGDHFANFLRLAETAQSMPSQQRL